MYSEKELTQFDRWEKSRPKSDTHGSEEDISRHMVRLMPTKWEQQGNQLIGYVGDTRVVNIIPTNMLLQGTDEQGLPILKKVVLK